MKYALSGIDTTGKGATASIRKWLEENQSGTMINVMNINGYQAVINYDPDIDMFRGEFLGLNDGADFYARDIKGLHQKGELSLRIFLEADEKDGVEPGKNFSGKFMLPLDPETHQAAAIAAASHGQSLNQWVASAIKQAAA